MNRNTITAAGAIGCEQHPNMSLERSLRAELLALSFNAFERCAGSLLRSLGYEDVLVRRDGREGRNRDGGWDIEAALPAGLARLRTIIQAKQYDSVPVQKRYVDELRGGMLRSGAHQGLLLTLSTFSDTAKDAASSGTIAPVRLIDGQEFMRLMIAHGIGVTKNNAGPFKIDGEYFERLNRLDRRDRARPTASGPAAAVPSGGATSVTVVVVSNGKPPRIEWKGGK